MAINSVSYAIVMTMTDAELHSKLITLLNLHITGVLPLSLKAEGSIYDPSCHQYLMFLRINYGFRAI